MSTSRSDENKVIIEIDELEVVEFKIENKNLLKDFAISPKGDFVVKFMVNDEKMVNGKETFEYELQMYTVDGKGSKLDDLNPTDERSSYRKLTRKSADFKFTVKQLDWIKNERKNEKILRWSVAVSDKSTSSPEFRLLAISCINIEDLKSYHESLNEKKSVETLNNGLTFVFVIEKDYSISPINDREISFKYGGIVKLFSTNDNTIVVKDNKQNTDEHFLIILTLTGVYKYHIKNKYVNKEQKLKYPKRMYYAINEILNFFFWADPKGLHEFVLEYIYKCLNKHYLLVDTEKKGLEYTELYDLKTNQLVNTFQKQVSNRPIKFDRPSYYAVSNSGKLLAYFSFAINGIKIYLTECGLEIAKLVDIFNKEIANQLWIGKEYIFIDFFPDENDDEKLFVYYSETKKWFVWDIFSLFRSSIKFLKGPFDEVPLKGAKMSNNLIVVDQNDEPKIYDDLIIHKYFKNLKKNANQSWKVLSSDYFSRKDLSNKIRDLHGKESEFKEPEFKNIYQKLEPWSIIEDNKHLRYSFYLDEEKKQLLLIGSHTIQVWYEQDKERSLEFIYAPISDLFNRNDMKTVRELQDFEKHSALEVIDIKYCIGKFKLTIKFLITKMKDEYDISIIKMEDDDDLMNVVKYACYTLKYFSVYKELEHVFLSGDEKKEFDFMIKQTKKIIWKFIKSHPTAFRLLDIHHDLMSVLIAAKDYELVNDILSFSELIHIPHYSKTIRNALSDNAMLPLFLEYYSNNAMNNIGWMNTVVDIIPELFKSYVQKLFNHPCFDSKQLDLLSFEFLEIPPALDGLLKVFIPITQLIPQNSKLDLQEIDFDKISTDKIVDIRMVPLPNFTTKKEMLSDISDISNERKRNYSIFQNLIMLPMLTSEDYKDFEENSSPFIKIIKDIKLDILCENPSMAESSTTTGEEADNPFSNFIASILAVYDWSSISFSTWNFWPLTIISVLGSFLFILILQNVIISFMSNAFTDAVTDSTSIYSYQVDFISYSALLSRKLKFNDLDFKLKDILRAKFICFYDDPSITSSWKKKSEQRSKPSSEMQKIKSEYKYESTGRGKLIWEEKDDNIQTRYWFL
ncbi:4105_t:CDS:2 [Cetraspora pellucida]|uniref:4105_t:CDS:1 n=1 Tax=Cetraspora pellucida TaxID=1433469 RepID=A0A9N9BLZ5_9GLOM|nr:4105_t:CDS:2 [Cetraspora pellucida]